MEAENCNPCARIQAVRKRAKKGVERGKFIVDRDPQRLKHPPNGCVAFVGLNLFG